jgi:hypothetical protein
MQTFRAKILGNGAGLATTCHFSQQGISNSTAFTRPSLPGDRAPPPARSKMIPARSLPKSLPSTASLYSSFRSGSPSRIFVSASPTPRRMEQLRLHAPQKITSTVADSALRVEMEALEPEQEGADGLARCSPPIVAR